MKLLPMHRHTLTKYYYVQINVPSIYFAFNQHKMCVMMIKINVLYALRCSLLLFIYYLLLLFHVCACAYL